MSNYTITRNGITFEIETTTDKWGNNRVTARMGDKTAIGQIPGTQSRAYPRIQFSVGSYWLHEFADHKYWAVDDYETDDDLAKRKTDNCVFDLTDDETRVISEFRPQHQTSVVRNVQHVLATGYRTQTNQIPHGQLWQPCEHPGCNNEPVCMNCMKCEQTHCHCFDGE